MSELRKVVLDKSGGDVGFNVVGGEPGEGVFVSGVVPGSQADQTGQIKCWDKLLKINGQDVSSASEAEVVKLLTRSEDKMVEIICQNQMKEHQELEAGHQEWGSDYGSQDDAKQAPQDSSAPKSHDGRKSGKKAQSVKSPRSRSSKKRSGSDMSERRSEGRGHHRKSDAERYEELSTRWDQAKQEVRLEDTETLREKVVLQQELIRRQDEYAEQRRLHLAMVENQKREEERAKKQAKEAELKKICKESLEEDKKQQRQEKAAKLRAKKNEPVTSTPSPSKSSPTKSPTSPTTPVSRGRRSGPFKMTLPAMSATPDLGDDDDDETPSPAFTAPKDVPWHEQQLYHLYGKKADYFLHPKIEPKQAVKKANPKLRRQGGRAGAEVLWHTLRQDSQQRLMQEDATIPGRLKEAYGAFARQSLKKTNMPVRRMYCVDNDLPELERLVDHSRVQKIHRMRHKTDLMYRSSVSNQDRTEVLTYNNPMPNFNSKAESINQYLPSWQDDESEESIPEYMRWVPTKGLQARQNTIAEEDEYQTQDHKPVRVTQSMDDDLMMIVARQQRAQSKQKFVFLSEKDTEVKGEFSDRFKDDRDYKDLPRPYDSSAPKSCSAMGGMISATPDKSTPSLRYSAPLPTRYNAMNRYTSGWEPLSMTALVEYKKQVSTVGEGDFNLGRTKMWATIPVI